MNYPAPVFVPPADPSAADLADFEQYIADQLRGRGETECADLEAYLRRFPGHSVADWKGKSMCPPLDAAPYHRPWSKLKAEEVREAATRAIARDLPRNVRQAAGRDPALIWNEYARKYRLRMPGDPPAETPGVSKVKRSTEPGPALAHGINSNTSFRVECSRAPARVSAPARR
jgi:hypothetical protein